MVGMALAFQKDLARPRIPQPGRIIARGGQPPPLRAKRHTDNGSAMSLALKENLARPRIPEPRLSYPNSRSPTASHPG